MRRVHFILAVLAVVSATALMRPASGAGAPIRSDAEPMATAQSVFSTCPAPEQENHDSCCEWFSDYLDYFRYMLDMAHELEGSLDAMFYGMCPQGGATSETCAGMEQALNSYSNSLWEREDDYETAVYDYENVSACTWV